MEIVSKLVEPTMLLFVVSSMLAVGLSLTLAQILHPLRDLKLVALSLAANFVVMPMIAVGIARALRLDEPLGVALLLLGAAGGAPFLPLLVRISKGNVAFSVALMVLLMVVTVGYMPIVLPFLLEGVSVDPLKIVSSLVLVMMLPLGIGLAVRGKFSSAAAKIRRPLNRFSTLSLAALILLLLVTNIKNVVGLFGTRGVLASVLFIVAGSVVGWIMGANGPDMKSVLALGTAQRNIAAALVVGGEDFEDARVVVMIVVV